MKTIRLNKKQIVGEGCFGVYFRVSKNHGIKIVKNAAYKNPINLKLRKNQEIIKEAVIGQFANNEKYELVQVYYKNHYYLGIKQKHFSGKIDSEIDTVQVKNGLNKKNIVHGDLHYRNIIVTKKGPKVVDFDPNFAYYVGNKRNYYIAKNKLIKNFKENFIDSV